MFTDPFAPTLEPFGNGSNRAFFLCETPDGPAVASSSCNRPKISVSFEYLVVRQFQYQNSKRVNNAQI